MLINMREREREVEEVAVVVYGLWREEWSGGGRIYRGLYFIQGLMKINIVVKE